MTSFPFSAVVGHDDLRLALLLNAVHPGVGGVLVRGEKGTAKSTAVRGLAALLPPVTVIDGCRFSCDPDEPDPTCPDRPHGFSSAGDPAPLHPDGPPPPAVVGPHATPAGPGRLGSPVPPGPRPASPRTHRPARLVELPVGATEDRLVGSLDLERALADGVRAYQPGLLAQAHRGVLYVDEVNLLHDHLVDLLLDAAAMGRAHVERDGVSISHAARFLLVGTMNPEEGELRPQLLDRFGLAVEVRASRDVTTRAEVVRRGLAFEADPAGFAARFAADEAATAECITAARARLADVRLPDAELRRIASVCAAFDVDGMRADLVIARAAVAHAAWRGAGAVTEDDVRVAARLALPHRRRRDPFDEPGIDDGALDDALRDAAEDAHDPAPDRPGDGPGDGPGNNPGDSGGDGPDDAGPDPDGPGPDGPGPDDPGPDGPGGAPAPATNGTSGHEERTNVPSVADGGGGDGAAMPTPAAGRARRLVVPGVGEGAPGRRSRARTGTGRVVRPSGDRPGRMADVHLPATLAAAAPEQGRRGRTGPGLVLLPGDLRRAVREGREGNLVLFAVDASGSMAARTRMAAVAGAVLALLRDAYQRRDKVGLVAFRGRDAQLVLPPTSSVPAARVRLAAMRTGGRTPLAAGLLRARDVLRVERLRDPRRRPLLVLLTDGRATVGVSGDPVADACRAAALLAADGVATVVVDCESGPVRLGLAGVLAAAAGGDLLGLDALTAEAVTDVVRSRRAA